MSSIFLYLACGQSSNCVQRNDRVYYNHFQAFCFFVIASWVSSTSYKAPTIFFQEFRSIWSINICTFSPSPYLYVWGHNSWIFATTTPSYSALNTFILSTNLTFSSILISYVSIFEFPEELFFPGGPGKTIIGNWALTCFLNNLSNFYALSYIH